MLRQIIKAVTLLLLAFLVLIQIAVVSGYYLVGDMMNYSRPARQYGVRNPPFLEPLPAPDADSNDAGVWLTSCGTDDLGVAVANVRTAVVYITGHRTTTSETLFPPRGPMPTSQTLLTGDKMGSGIIFDSRGYILTNYHVIADTNEIRVSIFSDRDKVYPCDIITADPKRDMAIIKIDVPYKLPVATFGNSDMIEAGDEVLAVGCPFNLEQSVTHGIVSDVKRSISIEGRNYVDLIQTDASINSGNSGGALIDKDGKVVGINVAIYAPNRVYCGVGFAIPINQAKLLIMKTQYLNANS